MRIPQIGFTLVLALATSHCARPDAGDDRSKPETPTELANGPGAKPRSDAPAAVRVPIEGLPVFGDARAPVTIVAFVDYDCPFCARGDAQLGELRAAYGNLVRVAIAMRPLPMHERARPAALALLAAAEQGRAEAMHARLFATIGDHDDESLRDAARAVGLDVRAFDAARTSDREEAALQRSEKLATSLGARGAPTYFVNGRRVVGAQPLADFRVLIDEELAKADKLVESGVAPEGVYDAIMAAAPKAVPPPEERPVIDDHLVEIAVDAAPVRGAAHAPVTVVVFSDFECPYCARLEPTLRALEAAYPGKVRVAWKNRPLPMHAHARLAAKAALVAQDEGRFWELHDALFAHPGAIDRASLLRYAADVGLDPSRFDRNLDDPSLEARLAADEAQAKALDVRGTPTLFVNGHRVTGAQPLATLRVAVDRALADAR